MTVSRKAEGTSPWHLRSRMGTAEIAGRVWPFIDTGGTGPVLVLLPGSVGTCEVFFKQIAALDGPFRVVAVSYPAEPDPARLADGLAGLLDRLRIEQANVLGSSFGGYWAQYVALRHGARVEKLFLGNIFVSPNELFAKPLFDPEWIRNTPAALIQQAWLERVEQAPDSELKQLQLDMLSGRQEADNLKARFLGVVTARLCPPLPLAPSQIVVIDCADDPIIPPASRQAVRDHYPGAAHCALPSGGHYPHVLNSEAYNAAIRQQLRP
ncbi:MAG TPA: alpha/beta hydrolase [Pseudolabrys sp.]|nr:alpha/beta hydrolase [Pseudolabrys sp.]